jgi:hypothetical protein
LSVEVKSIEGSSKNKSKKDLESGQGSKGQNSSNPLEKEDENPLMQGEKKLKEEDRSTEIVTLSKIAAEQMENISGLICSGANSFLFIEYIYLTLFIILFGTLIHFVAEHKPGQYYTTIAFVTGAYTSIICGYIGMVIATRANYRTAYKAQ